MPAFEYGHRSQEDTIAMPQTTGISRKASIPVALALSKQVTAPYDVGCELCKQVAEKEGVVYINVSERRV